MAGFEEDEVPIQVPTRVVHSYERTYISRELMKANRIVLKELGLLVRIPRMTKDSPIYASTKIPTRGGGHIASRVINGRAILAAQRRRDAGIREPLANKVLIPLAVSYSPPTATAGTKAKGIPVSLLKHPREDLHESPESLLDHPIPAADSALKIAKAIGGSVLKRHRVDLGESSDILAENLNSASDPSPTAGTEAEEKGGSALNKDVGESSEIVVETLNPGADSSAIKVASGAQAEVKGGSILKRPAADPSATVGTKDEMEGGSVLKRACVNLGESSELVAGNLNPADPSAAATGTAANVKGGSVLTKDLGE